MSTERNMEERLWDYIDGTASAAEKDIVSQLLEKDVEWKSKYKELLEVNSMLHSSELDAPSLRFTKNVMEEITRLHIAPATRTYINKKIIWGIASFFIIMILGFLIYGFAQMKWSVADNNAIVKNVNSLDLSKMFNNTWVNVLMMINIVIGLFLLDHYLFKKLRVKNYE